MVKYMHLKILLLRFRFAVPVLLPPPSPAGVLCIGRRVLSLMLVFWGQFWELLFHLLFHLRHVLNVIRGDLPRLLNFRVQVIDLLIQRLDLLLLLVADLGEVVEVLLQLVLGFLRLLKL